MQGLLYHQPLLLHSEYISDSFAVKMLTKGKRKLEELRGDEEKQGFEGGCWES